MIQKERNFLFRFIAKIVFVAVVILFSPNLFFKYGFFDQTVFILESSLFILILLHIIYSELPETSWVKTKFKYLFFVVIVCALLSTFASLLLLIPVKIIEQSLEGIIVVGLLIVGAIIISGCLLFFQKTKKNI